MVGVILILVGLFALVTPLSPGSWLALIGLELLGIRLVVQRKLLSLLPAKTRAKAAAALDRLAQNRWFRKLSPKNEQGPKDPSSGHAAGVSSTKGHP